MTRLLIPAFAVFAVPALAAPPKPDLRDLRMAGRELFKQGKFAEAIAEFDKLAAAEPRAEAGLWERGLAYYYAGRFKDAVKQFTGYDTVDKLDIENGLWHYLSAAKIEGLEAARKSMLGYQQRKRPPFPALLELYSGKGTEDAVLKQAEEGVTDAGELRMNRFFAHLYLGKHHEANGRLREALAHFEKAVANEITAAEFASGNFMWHCAKIEVTRVQESLKAKK